MNENGWSSETGEKLLVKPVERELLEILRERQTEPYDFRLEIAREDGSWEFVMKVNLGKGTNTIRGLGTTFEQAWENAGRTDQG